MAKSAGTKTKLPLSWIKIDNRVSALVAAIVVVAGYVTYQATRASSRYDLRLSGCQADGSYPAGTVDVQVYNGIRYLAGHQSITDSTRAGRYSITLSGLTPNSKLTLYALKTDGSSEELATAVSGPCS